MEPKKWAVIASESRDPLYTSFMSIQMLNSGEVVSYPLEKGTYSSVNKVQGPRQIRLELGLQGTEADFSSALATLDYHAKNPTVLIVVTPAVAYLGMTLETYEYARSMSGGAGMLIARCSFAEIKDGTVTESEYSFVKNPTSNAPVNVGKVQGTEVVASMAWLSSSYNKK